MCNDRSHDKTVRWRPSSVPKWGCRSRSRAFLGAASRKAESSEGADHEFLSERALASEFQFVAPQRNAGVSRSETRPGDFLRPLFGRSKRGHLMPGASSIHFGKRLLGNHEQATQRAEEADPNTEDVKKPTCYPTLNVPPLESADSGGRRHMRRHHPEAKPRHTSSASLTTFSCSRVWTLAEPVAGLALAGRPTYPTLSSHVSWISSSSSSRRQRRNDHAPMFCGSS